MIDQYQVPILVDKGLIKVNVPQGEHIVTLMFTGAWVRTIGNVISIIGLIVLFILTIKYNKSLIKNYER